MILTNVSGKDGKEETTRGTESARAEGDTLTMVPRIMRCTTEEVVAQKGLGEAQVPSLERMRSSVVRMRSSLVWMRSSLVPMRSSLARMRSSPEQMRSSLVRMRSSLGRMRSSLVRMRSSLVRMRPSLVDRASDCQCTCCNSPGFDPSIRRHSGI
jgi:hypothetical protein